MQDLLALGRLQPGNIDVCPAGNDLGNHILIDNLLQHLGSIVLLGICNLLLQRRNCTILQLGSCIIVGIVLCLLEIQLCSFQLLLGILDGIHLLLLRLPLACAGFHLLIQIGKFLVNLGKTLLCLRIGFILQRSLFDLQSHDLAVQLIQFHRHGIHLRTDAGTCLIHQVNGLIRQETIRDVAVRKLGRCNQSLILDLYAVIRLKAVLQTTQNRDGILNGRLRYLNLLESSFQCLILFDVLAVLIIGCGTNALQLASCQHRL